MLYSPQLPTDNPGMKRILAFIVCALLPTATAMAHPGHGHTDPHSPSHYVFEPVHAVALIAAIVGGLLLAWGGWKMIRRRSNPDE